MKIKHLALSLGLGLTALSLTTSCSKNEPTHPHDERDHEHHDQATRIVLSLIPVEVEDSAFDTSNDSPVSFRYILGEAPLMLTMQDSRSGWTHTPSQLQVHSTATNPKRAYILQLEHYEADGGPMNDELLEDGNDRMHQYFFLYEQNGTALSGNDPAHPWSYRYFDSPASNDFLNPSDNNPVGLKGLIRFKAGVNADATLRLALLHAPRTSKFIASTGLPSPWYQIDNSILSQSEIEIDQSIRLKIVD